MNIVFRRRASARRRQTVSSRPPEGFACSVGSPSGLMVMNRGYPFGLFGTRPPPRKVPEINCNILSSGSFGVSEATPNRNGQVPTTGVTRSDSNCQRCRSGFHALARDASVRPPSARRNGTPSATNSSVRDEGRWQHVCTSVLRFCDRMGAVGATARQARQVAFRTRSQCLECRRTDYRAEATPNPRPASPTNTYTLANCCLKAPRRTELPQRPPYPEREETRRVSGIFQQVSTGVVQRSGTRLRELGAPDFLT